MLQDPLQPFHLVTYPLHSTTYLSGAGLQAPSIPVPAPVPLAFPIPQPAVVAPPPVAFAAPQVAVAAPPLLAIPPLPAPAPAFVPVALRRRHPTRHLASKSYGSAAYGSAKTSFGDALPMMRQSLVKNP